METYVYLSIQVSLIGDEFSDALLGTVESNGQNVMRDDARFLRVSTARRQRQCCSELSGVDTLEGVLEWWSDRCCLLV